MAIAAGGRGVNRERLEATAVGRVQGVGFRYWTLRHANRLGLTGWVRNGDDEGSVEVVAEGDRVAVDELEALLRRGPPGARVERLNVRRQTASGDLDRFQIARR